MKRGHSHNRQRAAARHAALALALACPVLAAPLPAFAQAAGSVSDYQLPPGRSTEPSPAGPVDFDAPVVRSAREAPALKPGSPSPEASSAQAAPTAEAEPRPEASSRPAPRPTAAATSSPASGALPATAAPPSPGPLPLPAPTRAPLPEPTAAADGPSAPFPSWPALAALAALASTLLIGGLLLRRRRSHADRDVPSGIEPRPSAPVQPSAPAALPPSAPPPRDAGPIVSATSDAAASTATPLRLWLEAGELRRSLVFATLGYRLTLTNMSSSAVGPVIVTGDLVSAHATLSLDEQLRPASPLPALHSLPSLAAGESRTLTGSVRLPLAEVRPIRQGSAALFVPLVRIRAADAAGTWDVARVFVVGEPGQQRGALRPLRLDTMPGVTRGLVQREIVLDLAPAAG